jgi:hypothetical protein
VLPFGLRTAPRVFAKTSNIFARHWRCSGIRMLAYMDDWLFMARSAEEAREVIRRVRRDYLRAHVNINFEKSHLVPAQRLVRHLGFALDFAGDGTIEVPQDRWDHLQRGVTDLLRSAERGERVPARLVARVTGQIISMGLAIGDISRLFTRALYADIDDAPSWNNRISLSTAAAQELCFWSQTAKT